MPSSSEEDHDLIISGNVTCRGRRKDTERTKMKTSKYFKSWIPTVSIQFPERIFF